jgi:hypothetical protein
MHIIHDVWRHRIRAYRTSSRFPSGCERGPRRLCPSSTCEEGGGKYCHFHCPSRPPTDRPRTISSWEGTNSVVAPGASFVLALVLKFQNEERGKMFRIVFLCSLAKNWRSKGLPLRSPVLRDEDHESFLTLLTLIIRRVTEKRMTLIIPLRVYTLPTVKSAVYPTSWPVMLCKRVTAMGRTRTRKVKGYLQ